MSSASEGPPAPGGRPSKLSHPAAWVSSTYFAEGYPYSIVHVVAEVMFTELGASLKAIGLTSLLHLPWNLKFLWAPLLDSYGTKRAWMVLAQLVLAVGMLALALIVLGPPGLVLPTLVFAALAVVAATHDIAIDGYYLEALDPTEQSRWVALRAPLYRAALLLVGGPGLILASQTGFFGLFTLSGVLFFGLAAYHARYLPRAETQKRSFAALVGWRSGLALLGLLGAGAAITLASRPEVSARLQRGVETLSPALWGLLAQLGVSGVILSLLLVALVLGLAALPWLKGWVERSESDYADAFVSFLAKPRVGLILAFVLFFRTGESFLEKMRYPFLHRELGMSKDEYGLARTVGLVGALLAPALGGWLISRHGLRRWIWPFVLAQNGLNLLYWSLAQVEGPSSLLMGSVIAAEMVGAGFGTAVFMVYLMRCPLPGHKAAHFAILTALMSVSFTLAGVVSGWVAEGFGFERYFLLTVVFSIPGMAIIPFLPHLDEADEPGRRPSEA